MKHFLRVYALGLLTATLVFTIYYLFFNEPEIQFVEEELSEAEMITTLEAFGYYIYEDDPLESIDEEEIESTQPEQDEVNDEIPEVNDENEIVDSVDENELSNDSFILTIEEGMTITEVADILILEEIIEDRDELANYLIENDYGTNIQIGEFELTKDMSLAEVVETIARTNN